MTRAQDAQQIIPIRAAIIRHALLQLLQHIRIRQAVLQIAQLIGGIKYISKSKICDNDVAIPIQQQILEL